MESDCALCTWFGPGRQTVTLEDGTRFLMFEEAAVIECQCGSALIMHIRDHPHRRIDLDPFRKRCDGFKVVNMNQVMKDHKLVHVSEYVEGSTLGDLRAWVNAVIDQYGENASVDGPHEYGDITIEYWVELTQEEKEQAKKERSAARKAAAARREKKEAEERKQYEKLKKKFDA